MATLVLGAAGAALGNFVGGAVLGVSAATIGGFVGASLGSVIDSRILAGSQPVQRFEGPRLDTLRVSSASEGMVVPRVYGRMRVGGNVIWATDFREEVEVTETRARTGKGGGRSRTVAVTTEYFYFASFAVAVCEGPITGIGRIWADGRLLDLQGLTWRWYPGSEDQEPDPFIESVMGAGQTPAYRGTGYVVFEDLPLGEFGNRLPQLSFEVFRPLADDDMAEGLVPGVNIIPATGEFAYSTSRVRRVLGEGATEAENTQARPDRANALESLDRLQAQVPSVECLSIVVAWFGDDLRCGECTIRPKVESVNKVTEPLVWSVNGVARAAALEVSTDDEDRPVYGGTPSDQTVVELIQEAKARGFRVVFYPFILMDVEPGNELPNPYSDNAAELGQPVYPWRGRITCSPAPTFAGSPDLSSAVVPQVEAFFGNAQPGNFSVSGTSVSWTGPAGDWGLRRMILHYAHLCAAAGGVDSFLIGTEMRELTTIRAGVGSYPAVQQFRSLASACRSILGAGTRISYAADWSEYWGHRAPEDPTERMFHLDPLWADPDIDFVGIDNYMPLSDWRDGHEHLDAADWRSIYQREYLQANIAGGEGWDWFYASDADRRDQVRTPIEDGAFGKPWVNRYKALRDWWGEQHFDRPGGVEAASPTGWVPESKPLIFTEIGCPAVDRGTNQPNVFFDPKSSESFLPYFSRGWRDDSIQRAYIEASFLYWRDPANNPESSVYSGRMLDLSETCVWAWDIRPYPFFPALQDVWSDGENWRLGHWGNGRLGSVGLGALVRELCLRAGMPDAFIDVSQLHGGLEGLAITALESPRTTLAVLSRHFGFDAVESGGRIVFLMRDRAPVADFEPDDLVRSAEGEVLELARAQETELPLSLRWTFQRSDEEYDPAVVEARRITVDSAREQSEAFAFAVAPEEASRRVRRALQEAWTGREGLGAILPPSKLALDPGDVIRLVHDGRSLPYILRAITDGEARLFEAVRHDRQDIDLRPPSPVPARLLTLPTFGAVVVELMNLPQLVEEVPAHKPLAAAYAQPWPGAVAVWGSGSGSSGFALLTTIGGRARMGELAEPLFAGPISRWDTGNVGVVEMLAGQLDSLPDSFVLEGGNVLAVEAAPGEWEILQAAEFELVAPRRYNFRRLLRGQRGTEFAMGNPAPAGARVVVLDLAIEDVPIPESQVGQARTFRIGPAQLPVTDEVMQERTFTPSGAGLRPFSPAHVPQPFRRPREPGDFTIRWIRRDRGLAADRWEAPEVPMSEAVEAYEVEILDGSTVVRTLSSLAPEVVYAGADQIADFGSLLGPGDQLAIRIFQVSSAVGRGPALSQTLFF